MITYLIINKHKLSIIVSVINTNKLKNYKFFLYKPRCHVSKVYDLTQGRQFHDMNLSSRWSHFICQNLMDR